MLNTSLYSIYFFKADNILLREDGREIVLADFGVARRQTTKVSNLVGTPTHFSPEKAESRGHDFKSDLWAACCVLLHVLSGDPPWVRRYPNATALHFLVRYCVSALLGMILLNALLHRIGGYPQSLSLSPQLSTVDRAVPLISLP